MPSSIKKFYIFLKSKNFS